MLKNYFKIALRNLRRHPGYTTINVVGLAIGLACCLLIVQFVRHEMSYDRHHENADQIYRIVSDWGDFSAPATNPPFVRRLEAAYPAIKQAWLNPFGGLVEYEQERFREDRIYFANEAFFEVFTIDILRGTAEPTRPGTILLTPETAQKYFGDADPIGKTLEIDNQFELEVTGILEAAPSSAHFHYDFIISWASLDAVNAFDYDNAWGNNSIFTYLLLPEGFDPETLESAFPEFIEQHAGDNWNHSTLSLQPLTDIHLRSQHNSELEPNGNLAYLYMFSAIALFILLIACVNFMNLATARNAERAKEVGVRKVVGANRKQLIRQFLVESLMLSSAAVVLAVIIVTIAMPLFRVLAGRDIAFSVFENTATIPALVAFAGVVGVLAGSYPAFVLSGFRPISVLKGAFRGTAHGARLRKTLVVFQFATSIALIVGTGVVFSQLNHLREASLGFDKEQVLQLDMQDRSFYGQYPAFKEALLQHPSIQHVSIASEKVPSELLNGNLVRFEGAPEEHESMTSVRTVSVGHDFFETLGAEMQAGRTFQLEMQTDSAAFILNEAAWKLAAANAPESFGSPDESLGKLLHMGSRTGPLVGVVKDFNMASLHEAIEPIIFFFNPGWYDNFHIRVAPGDLPATLSAVEQTWRQFYAEWPFIFQFADQGFDARYRAEERLGQLFSVFALLALLVGCLGLFGLASFTAEQRTKEIGVRKVLGASVGNIVYLLSKDFTRLVLIALIVATPIAWIAMNSWLDGFAYRVSVGWWLFPLAGVLALFIAWISVGYQSIQAAIADPVDALRYE